MKTLYLFRHGQTEENIRGIVQGQRFGTLSEKGHREAVALGKRLEREPLQLLFSSDLSRAIDTIRYLAEARALPIHKSELLRERSQGIYEGRPGEDFLSAQSESSLSKLEYRPEGGESFQDVFKRAWMFLDMVMERPHKESLAICTHAGILVSMYSIILKTPLEELLSYTYPNASLSIVHLDSKGNFSLKEFNSTSHL